MQQLLASAALRATFLLALGTLGFGSCTPEQDVPTPSPGAADFSRYVAVGDSYTAGFSEGGLTPTSQQYSYPNLLAQQLAKTGQPVTFTQPTLTSEQGTGYLRLVGYTANNVPITARVRPDRGGRPFFANAAACGGADTVFLYPRSQTTLPQNLGVPGIRLTQIETIGLGNEANLNRVDQFNPYFERLLPAGDNRTYLQAVTDVSANATFFTFFMGMGDAIPYVLSGGECGTVPSISTLNANAKKILDRLTAGGRKGIIALNPDLSGLPILKQGARREVQSRFPNDTIFIIAAPANSVRQAGDNDFVLPSGLARLGRAETVTMPGGGTRTARYGLDRLNPLVRRDVLDEFQFTRINPALKALNTELIRLADNVYKLPYLDLEVAFFNKIANQISFNGVLYTTEPVRGNIYSLDMYSLTPRGNALLANEFIRVLNTTYKASIPFVDPNTLPTTARP
ncbi:hypothetical protein LJY25_11240 [Hymenobacter sp. BT175]|uniref:hypothetical protein n=1 Tax=Hymenobacter translucens TaxID=2886507 RepID=UPI001D0F14A3|nr:hypothetical protein [Hymenobacter translucens]MCC2547022.1 hypothetical protein [Hymenobacter translucens]